MNFLPILLSLALMQWSLMGPIQIDEGVILRLADQSPISLEQVVEDLAAHRVVLVGEAHDNPAHHQVQLTLIKRLHERKPEMAVAMEMFPRHLQPQLDRWVAGELTEEAFLDAVEWYFTWGFAAELYWPILRYAREARIPLLAMNIRRETVTTVRKRGLANLDQEILDTLPPMCPAPLAYRLRLEEVFQSHPMMSHSGRFEYFVEAQGVWDGVMADRIKSWSDAHPEGLVVGLVGSGHVIMGHGIPYQLRRRGVEDLVTLLPWVGAESWIDREAADYVWGTPETPDSPPPAQLGVTMDDQRQDGVWVQTVVEDSLASKAGIRPKDRIRQWNGEDLPSRHALVRKVKGAAHGHEIVLKVERDGREEDIKIQMP
ncbi:MAG: ChaN family lipoprotein [Magnetococcus sp. YQC-5]